MIAFAVWRRRSLRNVDILIMLLAAIALAWCRRRRSRTRCSTFFSFQKGGGGRILGLAVFAIFVLFLLTLRNAVA